MFDECKRRYYFNYYGSWGGWSFTADRRTRELYILKQLQTGPMLLGDSVHRVLENYLNELRKKRDLPLSSIVRQFRGFMTHSHDESLSGMYRENPKKYCGLLEHEYEQEVDIDSFIMAGEKCIKNFYFSDVLKEIKESDVNHWLPIEELQSFDLDGTTIYVKIDFATNGDKTIIYDWKTGKSSVDELQLACYALYAMNKWNVKLPVITRNYNLRTNVLTESEVDDVDWVNEKIKQSISDMKALLFNPETNTAREEDFPKNEGRRCEYCKFRKLCLE